MAQYLGDRFDESGRRLTISEVNTWLEEIEPHLDRFVPAEDLSHDLIKRQWAGRCRSDFPYQYTSVRSLRPMDSRRPRLVTQKQIRDTNGR